MCLGRSVDYGKWVNQRAKVSGIAVNLSPDMLPSQVTDHIPRCEFVLRTILVHTLSPTYCRLLFAERPLDNFVKLT